MNASTGNGKDRKSSRTRGSRKKTRQLLPALAAVGGACGLIPGDADALELGQLQVESTLGQPLRASIAYALNPHEQLAGYCIYLKTGSAANGLSYLSRARITVANGTITLRGSTPLNEPLLAMQMSVKCPYTAHLARNYTLMIDPAEALEPAAAPQVAAGMSASAVPATAPAETTAESRQART